MKVLPAAEHGTSSELHQLQCLFRGARISMMIRHVLVSFGAQTYPVDSHPERFAERKPSPIAHQTFRVHRFSDYKLYLLIAGMSCGCYSPDLAPIGSSHGLLGALGQTSCWRWRTTSAICCRWNMYVFQSLTLAICWTRVTRARRMAAHLSACL